MLQRASLLSSGGPDLVRLAAMGRSWAGLPRWRTCLRAGLLPVIW
jgi:hypothetical protein